MQPNVDPMESPKRRLSTLSIIMIGILGVCAVFLFLPSSRTSRIEKAKQRLSTMFVAPPDSEIQPLLNEELVAKNTLRKVDPKQQTMLYVFAPNPKDTSSQQFLSELEYPVTYNTRTRQVDSLVLLAPDPASTGWSILAKVWLAKAIQKLPTDEVRSLAQSLSYSGSMGALPKLKSIWAAVPPEIQKQAEDRLEKNRQIAKSYKTSRRFFHDSTGTNYEIQPYESIYEFYSCYYQVFPNRRAAQ